MITTPVRDDIRAFAAAVRAHLDDLPSDEVDDLLDGLEADLSDQAAEAGDAFSIPDATTYAAELRAAAGLPERSATPAGSPRTSVVQQVREGWREVGTAVRANPAGAWLLDLIVAMRPVWWLVRGAVWYVAASLVMLMFSPWTISGGILGPVLALAGNPAAWVLLIAAVILSVQWGRGHWQPRRWLRVVAAVTNVGAILLLPIFIGAGSATLTQAFARVDAPAAYLPPGLSLDGERVRNIFAFDAEGNAIPQVQLYTQDGKPLSTIGDMQDEEYDSYFYGGGGPVPVPYRVAGGSDVWNVFPLREIPGDRLTWDAVSDIAQARDTTFPFLRVQPVPEDATPDPAATPLATPTPPAATPEATPSAPQPAPDPTEPAVTP